MHLDFLHPYRRPSLWGWALLTLAVLALCGAAAWRYLALEPQIAAGEAQLTRLQEKWSAQEPVSLNLSDAQLVADRKQSDAVSQQLRAPWGALWTVLEGGAAQKVALLSLESDSARSDVLLSGEARDYPALLDYVRYLQSQTTLSAVGLQTHQVNKQDPDKPVRFRITAHWERAS